MENSIKEIYRKSAERKEKANFSTGFYDLDIFVKYLTAGDVLTIGGRPAMGKTNFAVSLVNHLSDNGKSVLYFSAQFSEEQFVQRLIAEKMTIPVFSLLENKVNQKEVNDILDSFENKKLYICDKAKLTTDEVEAAIKENKPEFVFIDYVQLLEMPKAPNMTEAINLAIKEIKRIAAENNVIIILLSQLSRAVEARIEKRPLLSDLRNGSLLEEMSSVILFIYRENYYDNEIENPRNEIIVAKNSIGPAGIVCLDFKNGFFRNPKSENTF